MIAYDKELAPAAANNRGHESNQPSDTNFTQQRAAYKPALKWQRTLAALLEGPKNSFELEKAPVFDHCPNSTVSELKKKHGLVIITRLIRVPGYANEGAQIAEYHLAAASVAKALTLLSPGT